MSGKTVVGNTEGRGKGSKGLGLGKTSASGAKRHRYVLTLLIACAVRFEAEGLRKVLKDNIQGVSKSSPASTK
jgi:hypothetical protein